MILSSNLVELKDALWRQYSHSGEVIPVRSNQVAPGASACYDERCRSRMGHDVHMSGSRIVGVVEGLLLVRLVGLLFAVRPVAAQPLSEDAYKTGDRIRAAFRPVVAEARNGVVNCCPACRDAW